MSNIFLDTRLTFPIRYHCEWSSQATNRFAVHAGYFLCRAPLVASHLHLSSSIGTDASVCLPPQQQQRKNRTTRSQSSVAELPWPYSNYTLPATRLALTYELCEFQNQFSSESNRGQPSSVAWSRSSTLGHLCGFILALRRLTTFIFVIYKPSVSCCAICRDFRRKYKCNNSVDCVF